MLIIAARTQEIGLVHNSDPRITYTGRWIDVSSEDQAGETVKLTRQVNATASFFFNGV
jgi:hypothetical protein